MKKSSLKVKVNHKPFDDISNTVYVITESSDNALQRQRRFSTQLNDSYNHVIEANNGNKDDDQKENDSIDREFPTYTQKSLFNGRIRQT